MSDNEEKQITCFFCEYYVKSEDDPNEGYCHRHAPRPIYGIELASTNTYWPEVCIFDWCGEFSRRDRHDSKYFEGLMADD